MTWAVALAIAAGGALGAPLRHLIETRITAAVSSSNARSSSNVRSFANAQGFPWGLLVVNAVGSLLIGVAYVVADSPWRELIATGAAGAFTTYSSYALFLHRQWQHDRAATWWAVFVMPAACISAAGVGIVVARAVIA